MIFVGLDLAPAASGGFALSDEGERVGEMLSKTTPNAPALERIEISSKAIVEWVADFSPNVEYVIIEDFAFAGRFSSYDIAMHAGVIRLALWKLGYQLLLVPPSSLRGWLAQEGIDIKQRDKKMPAIEFIMERQGMVSRFHRKGEYNHICDAGVLAFMGRMAYQLWVEGESVGTERQQDIFLSTAANKKGNPKGLMLRDEYLVPVRSQSG